MGKLSKMEVAAPGQDLLGSGEVRALLGMSELAFDNRIKGALEAGVGLPQVVAGRRLWTQQHVAAFKAFVDRWYRTRAENAVPHAFRGRR